MSQNTSVPQTKKDSLYGVPVLLDCPLCGREYSLQTAVYFNKKARKRFHHDFPLVHCGGVCYKCYGTQRNKIKEQRDRARHKHNPAVVGSLSTTTWLQILQAHDWRCNGCRQPLSKVGLSIDHVTPMVAGGKNDATNVQPLCIPCHTSKDAPVCSAHGHGKKSLTRQPSRCYMSQQPTSIYDKTRQRFQQRIAPILKAMGLNTEILSFSEIMKKLG